MAVILLYRVKSHGKDETVACSDSNDIVNVVGMLPNGQSVVFESEAYHLKLWAYSHRFTYESHVLTLDMDNLQVQTWTVPVSLEPDESCRWQA